ncbi:hypothetical protein E2C01_046394 [Portunus trituberculatus]|uniref:Ig-like domain-containing protein n=1 Tax=Portunus trituberculatus TaxID=210409 RepID=A0A5B7G5N1_PORTR|nr:hypothetical protein [Portunus trituberculatus]
MALKKEKGAVRRLGRHNKAKDGREAVGRHSTAGHSQVPPADGAGGVRITKLDVPAVALEGDDVHLRCDYEDESGSSLYTLKWYKDDQEFFRHQPGRAPREGDDHCHDHYLYHVDGVTADVSTES